MASAAPIRLEARSDGERITNKDPTIWWGGGAPRYQTLSAKNGKTIISVLVSKLLSFAYGDERVRQGSISGNIFIIEGD